MPSCRSATQRRVRCLGIGLLILGLGHTPLPQADFHKGPAETGTEVSGVPGRCGETVCVGFGAEFGGQLQSVGEKFPPLPEDLQRPAGTP